MFVRDSKTGNLELASRAADGALIVGTNILIDLTANRRFVAFMTSRQIVVPGYVSSGYQLFVRDRKLGMTMIRSLDEEGNAIAGGIYRGAISSTGRFFAFAIGAPQVIRGVANGER